MTDTSCKKTWKCFKFKRCPKDKIKPHEQERKKKMKHVMMSSAWEFGTDPFPAYRVNLVYGRNKHDREFLPMKDVTPMTQYTVTADYEKTVLYTGTDKVMAEKVKGGYDADQKAKNPESSWPPTANLKAGLPKLPEGKFRIIKTKEKGTILIVPGSDDTNRCLLFIGCKGGFRGGESIVQEGTTGQLLKQCSAGNNCESSTEAIVLLEVGQSIAFHTFGRRTDEVYLYTWNGTEMENKHFSIDEWKARNSVATPPIEDAEVL